MKTGNMIFSMKNQPQGNVFKGGETVNVVYLTVGKMKKIYKMIEQPKDEESEKLTASREEKREVKMTAAAGGNGAV